MALFRKSWFLIFVGMVSGIICAQLTVYYQNRPIVLGLSTRSQKKSPIDLLAQPWSGAGNKSVSEDFFPIPSQSLENQNKLNIRFNTHGACLLDGKAASIMLETDDPSKNFSVPIVQYAEGCSAKDQDVLIPLSDFGNMSDLRRVTRVHLTFWFSTAYSVDVSKLSFVFSDVLVKKNKIKKVKISAIRNIKPSLYLPAGTFVSPTLGQSGSPTLPISVIDTLSSTPQASATSTLIPDVTTQSNIPVKKQTWPIQSVSSMKETKDKICFQDSELFINRWVEEAKRLGATYISIETPYDSPTCGDSLTYTKTWIKAIRSHGLHVWHRHMPVAFEGIYNMDKKNDTTYLAQIAEYIKANKDDFMENDIFTPIPEPQNGGIAGITSCTQDVCQFKNAAGFNQWLRDAMDTVNNAFDSIGLKNKINTGYFGFDGFIVWGSNNADWDGILEDRTISRMGNITIDHYPETIGSTMEEGLNELQAKYPNVPIMIGEWGTIGGTDLKAQVESAMTAAKRPNIIGFNYWQMGMGGNEALLNADFSEKEHYKTVQSFFIPH